MSTPDVNDSKAEFLGAITCSVTHEIQNVLAIIKENSGLMEDFILMNPNGSVPGLEKKLAACIDKIKKQAYRGVGLTSELNSFAHGPDKTTTSINIVELIKKLVAVSERFFKLKGIDILLTVPDQRHSITTDPVLFQMIIFSCINCLIEIFKSKTMLIDFQAHQELPCVRLSMENAGMEPQVAASQIIQTDGWKNIQHLCRKTNMNITPQKQTTGIRIFFSSLQ
ncbi:MAG: hypothetical protein L3J69_09070 [Desulfobacula sp.]|nr:hypothetical protein [Desulfobacula sp.]